MKNTSYNLIIPGIGGHTDFHSSIKQKFATSEESNLSHGDFYRKPFRNLTDHVEYWSTIIQSKSLEYPEVNIIAISFGSAVVQSLPFNILKLVNKISLVSPILSVSKISLIISLFETLDCNALRWSFGKSIFYWSNLTSKDKKQLYSIREKVYKEETDTEIYSRLWYRFLSLKTLTNFDQFQLNIQQAKNVVQIIYTQNEILRRLNKSLLQNIEEGTSNIQYCVIPGAHSESINQSANLNNHINEFLHG